MHLTFPSFGIREYLSNHVRSTLQTFVLFSLLIRKENTSSQREQWWRIPGESRHDEDINFLLELALNV